MGRFLELFRRLRAKPTTRRGASPMLVGLESRQLLALGPLSATAAPQILRATGALIPIVVTGSFPAQVQKGPPKANFFVIDEYRQVEPRGPVQLVQGKTLDAKKHVYTYNFTFTTYVQASRSREIADGRHYDITVAASDPINGQSKTLPVIVPR